MVAYPVNAIHIEIATQAWGPCCGRKLKLSAMRSRRVLGPPVTSSGSAACTSGVLTCAPPGKTSSATTLNRHIPAPA
jgi:hypothetical protein